MSTENKTEENEKQMPEFPEEEISGQNSQSGADGKNTQESIKQQNSPGRLDPGAAWAAENAVHTGEDNAENMKSAGIPGHVVMLLAACLVILLCLLLLVKSRQKEENLPEESQTGVSLTQEAATAATAGTAEPAGSGKTEEKPGSQSQTSGTGRTSGKEKAAPLSPEMEALSKNLRSQLAEKNGEWSLYLYRLDTEEEIGINDNEPMISASLIKLYIAGCYLEQVEKGNVPDDYQQQLFAMLSASDNGATNQLIDLLGMDQINAFIQEHNYGAGRLNRKMLENNGTENYTSARDCGNVLRSVYDRTYINKEASQRVEEAMRAQIARNLYKIPAGVPEGVETANKTGELFTKNAEGVNVDVQNDAAIIFAGEHPYVLVVMTAVPGAGEAQMHEEISAISSEIYKAVCGE